MSNRLDNLQTVFDRTDWAWLRKQAHGLQYKPLALEELANWLEALLAAAKMDGYQTTKEPTQ